MNEVMGLKLVNGDELIGRMVLVGDAYHVENPRALRVMQTANGPVAGLMPWLMTISEVGEREVQIPANNALTLPYSVSKAVEEDYIKQTTGIVLAT